MEQKTYRLAEIGQIVSGATPRTSDPENFGGNIAWITPADLSGYKEKYIAHGAKSITQKGYDSCSTQLMPAGTVLFSSRAPIGYVAIAKNPVCTNQGFKSVIPNDSVNSEFLYYQLLYLRKQIQDMGSGTTFKEISAKKFGQIEVVLPEIPIQKRIVARIEELFSQLDSGVETLRKAKQQLAVYRQAVLKKAFSLSDHWTQCKLGDVIETLTDYHANGSYKILKENVTLLDEPNFAVMVRSTNFEKDDFKVDLKYIDKHSYDFLKKSQLYSGEVLMGKIGNAGRVYYMRDLGRPMSLAMNMFAMRYKNNLMSKFVYYYLLSPEAAKDIKQYIRGVGTPTIDKKSVRNIKFRYPNMRKQKRIVSAIESRLSVCDSIERTVNTALQQAEAMRQSF